MNEHLKAILMDSSFGHRVKGNAVVLWNDADLLAEANGKRVEWCATHNAESVENHGGTTDECWRVVWVPHDEPEGVGNGYSLCRIVSRLLVDPTTEEER